MKALRVILIGYGAINKKVAETLASDDSVNIDIVGVALRDEKSLKVPLPEGAKILFSPDELKALKPDLIVEAAGKDAIKTWGKAALEAAPAFAIASTSSLADEELLQELIKIAELNGSQILIPPGALGAVDALAAAAIYPLKRVTHTIIKPVKAWSGTKAETLIDLYKITEAKTFFKGNARDAALAFPQNANVTVISSLAGIGLELTRVEMIADPKTNFNSHKILAEGMFGRMRFIIENYSIPENPKTSLLTALSLVRLIKNRVQTVVV